MNKINKEKHVPGPFNMLAALASGRGSVRRKDGEDEETFLARHRFAVRLRNIRPTFNMECGCDVCRHIRES